MTWGIVMGSIAFFGGLWIVYDEHVHTLKSSLFGISLAVCGALVVILKVGGHYFG